MAEVESKSRDVIVLSVEALVTAESRFAGDINANAFHSSLQKIFHHSKKKIKCETIFGASPESFCNAVGRGKVLHVNAFGSADGFVLENNKRPGQSVVLKSEEVRNLMSSVQPETCMVVVLSKFAEAAANVLIEAGIPCVCAIQFTKGLKLEEEIEDFLKEFYESLFEGGNIDGAFSKAQQFLRKRRDEGVYTQSANSAEMFQIFGDTNQTPYETKFEKAKFQDMNEYTGRYRIASPIYTFFSRNTLMYQLIESYLRTDTITWISAFEGSGKSAMLNMSSWYCACRKIFENILYINVSTSHGNTLVEVVSQALRQQDQQNEAIYARTTVNEVYLTITKERLEKSGPFLENGSEEIRNADQLVTCINECIEGTFLLILDSALAHVFSDQEVWDFAKFLSDKCPRLKVVISSSQVFNMEKQQVDVMSIPKMKSDCAMKMLLSQCEKDMIKHQFPAMSEKDIIKRLKNKHFIGVLLRRYALPGIVKMIAQTLTLSNLSFSNIPERKLLEIAGKVGNYHSFVFKSDMDRQFAQKLVDMNEKYSKTYGGRSGRHSSRSSGKRRKTPKSPKTRPKPVSSTREDTANKGRVQPNSGGGKRSSVPRFLTKAEAMKFTKEEVGDFVAGIANAYTKYRDAIIKEGIDGSVFEMLADAEMLAELGITNPIHKKVITKKVNLILQK